MTERFKPFCAVFLVLEREGKVLLQRRKNTDWSNGLYSLPSGHIEGDEPATACIIRETKEEICVDVAVEDLTFVHALHVVGPDDGREYVNLFFRAERWVGELAIGEPDKADELRWASIRALPDNTVPFVKDALEQIAKGSPYSEFGWDSQRLTD